MARRNRIKRDLGEAISLEDALSIMVVIFVLFILFLVPLVNFDKIRTAKVEIDTFWKKSWHWARSQDNQDLSSYRGALGFNSDWEMSSQADGDNVWIHVSSADSILWVFHHSPNSTEFSAVKTEKFQTVLSYRLGNLAWSPSEREYVVIDERFDYGEDPQAKKHLKGLQSWSKTQRDF
jgi:hypothetical protein